MQKDTTLENLRDAQTSRPTSLSPSRRARLTMVTRARQPTLRGCLTQASRTSLPTWVDSSTVTSLDLSSALIMASSTSWYSWTITHVSSRFTSSNTNLRRSRGFGHLWPNSTRSRHRQAGASPNRGSTALVAESDRFVEFEAHPQREIIAF